MNKFLDIYEAKNYMNNYLSINTNKTIYEYLNEYIFKESSDFNKLFERLKNKKINDIQVIINDNNINFNQNSHILLKDLTNEDLINYMLLNGNLNNIQNYVNYENKINFKCIINDKLLSLIFNYLFNSNIYTKEQFLNIYKDYIINYKIKIIENKLNNYDNNEIINNLNNKINNLEYQLKLQKEFNYKCHIFITSSIVLLFYLFI
jgi:hypothetical protein